MFEGDLPSLLETLGPDDPVSWMVDKDYWLTRVLRRLNSEMAGAFLFKGGTSLSMGYSLIERFSEDIDLLVGAESAEETMRDIVALAEEELGEKSEVAKDGDAYRFLIIPFRSVDRAPARLSNHRQIRMDIGAQGGEHPNETRQVAPMVSRLVQERGVSLDDEDLQPFDIEVLHPARTCLEKLEAVHSAALEVRVGVREGFTSRDGKHPYDVYQILGHQPSVELLSDPGLRADILQSIDEANRRWFGGPSQRPKGGYADSPAFLEGEISTQLRDATARAMRDYLWKDAEEPTWDEILQRVEASQSLL